MNEKPTYEELQAEIRELKQETEETERSYQAQLVLNKLLFMSLEDVSLSEMLEGFLLHVTSIKWLSLNPMGAALLVEEEDPGGLVMKAHCGLPDLVISLCSRVPFGKCLCGKSALTREVIFADCLDHRHELQYRGMHPHGHYCIPIISETNKLLGVFTLYMKEGCRRDEKVEEILIAIARVAARIIRRKQIAEEQEMLQAQLIQSQKMESIGRLAGGIAHDFNNILSVILGYCDLIIEQVPAGSLVAEDMLVIKDSGEKGTALTRQLLAFSRKQVLKTREVNLDSLIENMTKMLGRIIGEDIELKIKQNTSTKRTFADPAQIEQVLMNLVVNARDAMLKGGHLMIETSDIELGPGTMSHHEEMLHGRYAVVSISDTGIGMTSETQKRIFEPFFTTKEGGKGTGLGLATVYGIVKQHHGYIYVYSEPDKGSTFKIYLPMAEDEPLKSKEETSQVKPKGTETLLVVEDDRSILKMISKILIPLGYTFLEAANGQEALDISFAYEGDIDLLLTDIIMPGMNGLALAKKLQVVRPAMKVAFMPGYTHDVIDQYDVPESGITLIQKPLDPLKLANKLREILNKP